MDARVSQRIGMAAAAAASTLAVAAGLVLFAAAARSGEAGQELRPDLVVQPPSQVYLTGKRKVGTLSLRLSNTIANKGTGPLEITGGDGDDSCNLPGKPVGRHTLQTAYRDSLAHPGHAGYFKRGQDTEADQYVAGCSRYHPAHDHWHFDNFARFSLTSERTGTRVGTARKVSFCVIDTGRPFGNLPGSPKSGYYPKDPKRPNFPSCSATSVDGLSVGWEDTYGAGLPGQAIKVGKLRRGRYCLVLEADPAAPGDPGALAEQDETNNVRTVRLRILPGRKVVHRLGATCRRPPA